MNLNEIESKCFIMALFIRDDGLRFLLGSGAYEFKDSQLMFAGNTIENDVVSVQGNDGYMLAGQVRRPSTQVFNGYIGDATVTKSEVEGYRRDFMAFFQKNHFYTVVYIMADGSAIQRRRGFLVDAPTSQELWQMYPEYHVALNFEDVNYYKYSENDEGEETYAKSADIGLAKVQYGGLIWANNTDVQVYNSGINFNIADTEEDKQVDYIDLYGDTQQQTYSGKNLLNPATFVKGRVDNGNVGYAGDTSSLSYTDSSITFTTTASYRGVASALTPVEASTQYNASAGMANLGVYVDFYNSNSAWISRATSKPFTTPSNCAYVRVSYQAGTAGTYTMDYPTLVKGATIGTLEPYVGGTASPNPDYPQEVQTVTGRQVVTISDGDSESQEYEINLGKNLFDKDNAPYIGGYFEVGGSISTSASSRNRVLYIPCKANTTYSLTKATGAWSGGSWMLGVCHETPAAGVSVYNAVIIGNNTTYNGYTTDSSSTYLVLRCQNADSTTYGWNVQVGDTGLTVWQTVLAGLQIEKGSTATTYAPYFTPIELCKIGDYQDYIYSVNGTYYLHKEIDKYVITGANTESWGSYAFSVMTEYIEFYTSALDNLASQQNRLAVSDNFTNIGIQLSPSIRFDSECFSLYTNSASETYKLRFAILKTRASSVADWRTWLGSHNTTIYFVLNAPTDTEITDAALISQLDALNTATTYDNITWFRSESPDLPAIVWAYATIKAGGGVVWDNYGAEWEDGGGGEIVVVNVDSIENIFPVWTIRGKAINPTLTNLTTGMSIVYNGTVASGQTLVIDMLNKTAKLNGTSVISDISGQWVEFQPGNNRVSYSADNAEAPDSTIEWQEVVG